MFKYIFGPVPSRRLGLSLGIDLLGAKICSMNCVYCEVRKTEKLTMARKAYVPGELVIRELDLFFRTHPGIDLNYITFSGQGEPTLSTEISPVIRYMKACYPYKIAVLTNGTLLDREDVRKDLLGADLIVPSLDAVSQKVYKAVNHPHNSVRVENVIKGIKALRKEFSGELHLEILIVKGINDSDAEISLLKEKVRDIAPDKVYVHSIHRPPAFSDAESMEDSRIEELQMAFESCLQQHGNGLKTISSVGKGSNKSWDEKRLVGQLESMLYVRPCTLEDLTKVFCGHESGLKSKKLKGILDSLVESGILELAHFDRRDFYCLKRSKVL
ncbi:MAG: radical SAM protein [Spirochaetota bacterium]|nr:radical SAM protein [Spirochaetota bacterium]